MAKPSIYTTFNFILLLPDSDFEYECSVKLNYLKFESMDQPVLLHAQTQNRAGSHSNTLGSHECKSSTSLLPKSNSSAKSIDSSKHWTGYQGPRAANSRAGHPNTAFAASFQVPSRTDRGLSLHSEGLLEGTPALLGQQANLSCKLLSPPRLAW